jgi:hypothetical protein
MSIETVRDVVEWLKNFRNDKVTVGTDSLPSRLAVTDAVDITGLIPTLTLADKASTTPKRSQIVFKEGDAFLRAIGTDWTQTGANDFYVANVSSQPYRINLFVEEHGARVTGEVQQEFVKL